MSLFQWGNLGLVHPFLESYRIINNLKVLKWMYQLQISPLKAFWITHFSFQTVWRHVYNTVWYFSPKYSPFPLPAVESDSFVWMVCVGVYPIQCHDVNGNGSTVPMYLRHIHTCTQTHKHTVTHYLGQLVADLTDSSPCDMRWHSKRWICESCDIVRLTSLRWRREVRDYSVHLHKPRGKLHLNLWWPISLHPALFHSKRVK